MFTGIVEARGRVVSNARGHGGLRLRVAAGAAFDEVALGASVCVSGACLTVVANSHGTLEFDVVAETTRRTRLGRLRSGDSVNLERSLPVTGRLEGHIVLGHVDAVVAVSRVKRATADWLLTVRIPPDLGRFVAEKGSFALDGVSLTIASLRDAQATVALIPATRERTTLGRADAGALLHLEVDVLA